MMKKIMVLILGIALVLSMAGAVAGDGKTIEIGGSNTDGSSFLGVTKGDETIVQLTVGTDYLITIPSVVDLQTGGVETTAYMNVSKLLILPNETLTVSVKSLNGWKVKWFADGGYKMNPGAELGYIMAVTTDDDRVTPKSITLDSSSENTVVILEARVPEKYKLDDVTTPGSTTQFVSEDNKITTTLKFTLNDPVRYSGYYKDSLTFEVKFEEYTENNQG